jgi:D-glycero-D-manno-heptose 1,7-bisphosphate phosphatase
MSPFLLLLLQLTTSNSLSFSISKKLPKLFLIDRDGVINQDVGSPGVLSPSQLQLTPGAGIALGKIRRAGCKVAVITNQSCVGKGLISEQHLVSKIHGTLQDMLLLEDPDAVMDCILYCTSLRGQKVVMFE